MLNDFKEIHFGITKIKNGAKIQFGKLREEND